MFVKGEQPQRVRSEEKQAIMAKVLPRLQSGENSFSLAAEFGLSASTLRTWKQKYCDKLIVKKSNELNGITQILAVNRQQLRQSQQTAEDRESDFETLDSDDIENDELSNDTDDLEAKVIQTDQLKTAIQRQAAKATVFLGQSNSPVLKTLNELGSLARESVRQYRALLKNPELELKEKLKISKHLKELVETVNHLYCLPLGAQKVSAFEGAKAQSGAQHLHIHSHGGSSGCLVKGRKKPVAAISPPADVVEVQARQAASAGELAPAQLDLVRDL